jgi:hypothetical protein
MPNVRRSRPKTDPGDPGPILQAELTLGNDLIFDLFTSDLCSADTQNTKLPADGP